LVVKKENRKLAQERRARERERAERRAKAKKIVPTIIIVAAIAVIVIATIVSAVKKQQDADTVSSSSQSSVPVEASSSDGDGTTLDTTAGTVVEDGDTVNLDYTGYIDGEAFDGGSTNGEGTALTLGSGSYIDGFEDAIVGHTVGETFDIQVTFPEDYSATNLAGKEATFSITLNGVYR
jgi:FKBP-type peptidyl-prolyl cis-trans isomerase (trigger factor)